MSAFHPDRLAELIAYAQQLLAEMGLQGSMVGHVGDGNFHTVIATKPEDYEHVQAFSERLVRQALHRPGEARIHGRRAWRERGMDAPPQGLL